MNELTRELLWEHGIQYGHKTDRWNPKMKQYIFGIKNHIHIMDLQKTMSQMREVAKFVKELGVEHKKIIFVGTSKQAKWAVKEAAERSNNFYVNERWLGGTLTNLKTIHLRIKRLWDIERDIKSGKFNLYVKKEQIVITKEKNKLEKFLKGIRSMRSLPAAIFVTNPLHDQIAVKEAVKLKIPVIAICDSNADPDLIDYVIPANDDHFKALSFMCQYFTDAYAEGAEIELRPLKERPPIDLNELRNKRFKKNPWFYNNYKNTRENSTSGENKPERIVHHTVPINPKYKRFKSNTHQKSQLVPLTAIKKNEHSMNAQTKVNNLKPLESLPKLNPVHDKIVNNVTENKIIDKKIIKVDNNVTENKIVETKPVVKKIVETKAVVNNENNKNYLNDVKLVNNNVNDSLTKLKVIALKEIAKENNIKITGLKKDIVNQLSDNLEITDNKLAIKK